MTFRTLCRSLALAAAAAMLIPAPTVFAADGHTPVSAIRDVKLTSDSTLIARIVDLQGNPMTSTEVKLLHGDRVIASAVSNANGYVAVAGVRPGMHTIATPAGQLICRVWDAQTAPPAASAVPAVVSDEQIVRGQFGGLGLGGLLTTGLTIASFAIAIDAQETADDAEDAARRLSARVEALENASP